MAARLTARRVWKKPRITWLSATDGLFSNKHAAGMRFKCAFIRRNWCLCSANSWSKTVQRAALCRIIQHHIPVCTALICWSDLDPPFQTPFWERGLSRGACGETGKVYKETKMGGKASELWRNHDQKIELPREKSAFNDSKRTKAEFPSKNHTVQAPRWTFSPHISVQLSACVLL